MKRLTIFGLFILVVTLLSVNGLAWAREPQPGDDRGGHGHDNGVISRRGEPEPGDDRGGHGNDETRLAKGEPQPGDNRGGHGGDDTLPA